MPLKVWLLIHFGYWNKWRFHGDYLTNYYNDRGPQGSFLPYNLWSQSWTRVTVQNCICSPYVHMGVLPILWFLFPHCPKKKNTRCSHRLCKWIDRRSICGEFSRLTISSGSTMSLSRKKVPAEEEWISKWNNQNTSISLVWHGVL